MEIQMEIQNGDRNGMSLATIRGHRGEGRGSHPWDFLTPYPLDRTPSRRQSHTEKLGENCEFIKIFQKFVSTKRIFCQFLIKNLPFFEIFTKNFGLHYFLRLFTKFLTDYPFLTFLASYPPLPPTHSITSVTPLGPSPIWLPPPGTPDRAHVWSYQDHFHLVRS